MNNLYRMELMSMVSDLDSFLDSLFENTGFYESEKCSKDEFKKELLKDYLNIFLK